MWKRAAEGGCVVNEVLGVERPKGVSNVRVYVESIVYILVTDGYRVSLSFTGHVRGVLMD